MEKASKTWHLVEQAVSSCNHKVHNTFAYYIEKGLTQNVTAMLDIEESRN